MSTCVTPDEKYLFVNNSNGVKILPIWNRNLIHTEFIVVWN